MRICVHDFTGHPFQYDLSRALAARGHEVLHLYSAAFDTPKSVEDRDRTGGLIVDSVDTGLEFAKYGAFKRAAHEIRYGWLLRRTIERFGPDVVLSSNAPLLAQIQLIGSRRRYAFVHWWQDIQFRAVLDRFGGTPLAPAGWALRGVERSIVRRSDAVVGISEAFRTPAYEWGAQRGRIHVVPNWSPIQELPEVPRDNEWSREHGLGSRPRLVYSGTLGLKHNPELLAAMAEDLGETADVIVVSEGLGADYLRKARLERSLDNLTLLPFQPFDRLPEVFGSADVLVAILEPEAGAFSVPSKVLSYLCGGRPLLLAVPSENLAAATVKAAEAGLVVDPQDEVAFVQAARRLVTEQELRKRMGERARRYAERTFDVEDISERFEAILRQAIQDRLA